MQLLSQTQSYADQKNNQYHQATSHIIAISDRWAQATSGLNPHYQTILHQTLQGAIAEFKNRYPEYRKFNDIPLAKAATLLMSNCTIDTTLQRELDVFWCLKILSQFSATMVMPLNVFQDPETKEWCIWDGQHTMIVLWLIATKIFNQDPSEITIPACLYHISQRAQIRNNLISLNSREGKKMLEDIDHWQQALYGVRIDNSKNPKWLTVDRKQKSIESRGMFVTHAKFNDTEKNGAISRLQEINNMSATAVDNLMEYLYLVGGERRPVVPKEMMMMGPFFKQCDKENIDVDRNYVKEISLVFKSHFEADFSPNSLLWDKVKTAYHNWHHAAPNTIGDPSCNKEWSHAGPFLVAQLRKDCPQLEIPSAGVRSEFQPMSVDLF